MNPLLIQALKDGAQGASNAIADQVSAPVDNVMGKLSMVGIKPQQPILGSSGFMQQFGAKAPATGMSADIGKLIGGQIMGMAMGAEAKFHEWIAWTCWWICSKQVDGSETLGKMGDRQK